MSVRSPKRLAVEPLEGREVPATFTVTTVADVVNPNDGRLSLREAISRANATPGLDTVRLPAGVFGLTLPGVDDQNAAGDLDVTDTLTVVGAGPGRTVIDGRHLAGLFDVQGPIAVTLTGLTLRNAGGQFEGGAVHVPVGDLTLNAVVATGNVAVNGGAINAGSGTVTVRNSRLVNNSAHGGNGGAVHLGTGRLVLDGSTVGNNFAVRGGGVFAEGGTVTLSGSTVTFNTAAGFGGGIASAGGPVSLTGSSVRGNLAGGEGGGISAQGAVTLTGSSVTGNRSSDDGGGIAAASATLVGSTIDANAAAGNGGGLFCTTATLTASTVSHNTSGSDGGGIRAQGTVTLVRSTVSGNTADGGGGGIAADTINLTNATVSGNVAGLGPAVTVGGGGVLATHGTIRNSTIVENRTFADFGGGVCSPASADPIRVQNTIIAQNFVRSLEDDVFGTFAGEGNNLVGVVDGNSQGFSAAIDLVGTDDDPLDPRLGELAFNGGPTRTHALLAGSPAIDQGSNLGAPAVDQRGFRRVKDGNGDGRLVIDIGAVER
jgi:CSLREA domain-containing protein